MKKSDKVFPEPMILYENTMPAVFGHRINRFVAEVMIGDKKERVHVKNTGRLRELLVSGAQVTLQKAADPNRKTGYDLISVYKPGLEWVNIDSLAPNVLMKQYYLSQGYDVVRPEYSYGDSRFDFYLERHGEKYLTEVKGCTLAADPEEYVYFYTDRAAGQGIGISSDVPADPGIGLFPDAPTERGVKHLRELASAAQEGYHCTIAFVIQMNGIRRVFPNDAAQPEFGQALARAVQAGVRIEYYGCRVEADRIRIIEAGIQCEARVH